MQAQPPRQDAFLSLADVAKQFGRFTALSGVSLEVARGDLVTFLGPSGCGKTTLLRIIAGLEFADPGSGTIQFNGEDVTNVRAGFEQVGKRWRVAEFVRVDNIADKAYIGSVIVAEGNRRFYEPAPGRNWLVGVAAELAF